MMTSTPLLTHANAFTTVTEPTGTVGTQSISLLELAKHQIAYIDNLQVNPAFGAQDSLISKRLHDLGFLPNTAIKIVAKGLFGRPPFAVQLAGGSQFSLRREEVAKIQCRLL